MVEAPLSVGARVLLRDGLVLLLGGRRMSNDGGLFGGFLCPGLLVSFCGVGFVSIWLEGRLSKYLVASP